MQERHRLSVCSDGSSQDTGATFKGTLPSRIFTLFSFSFCLILCLLPDLFFVYWTMRETHFRSAVSCYQATELVTGAVSLGFRLRLVVVSVSCSCPFCHISFTARYGRDHLHLWSEGTTEATLADGKYVPRRRYCRLCGAWA